MILKNLIMMYKTSLQEYLLHYQNCKHAKNGNAILAACTLCRSISLP
jgi:hypothetical protein